MPRRGGSGPAAFGLTLRPCGTRGKGRLHGAAHCSAPVGDERPRTEDCGALQPAFLLPTGGLWSAARLCRRSSDAKASDAFTAAHRQKCCLPALQHGCWGSCLSQGQSCDMQGRAEGLEWLLSTRRGWLESTLTSRSAGQCQQPQNRYRRPQLCV